MQVVRKEVEHLGECDVIEDGDEGDDNIYVLKDPNDGWMGCIVCLQYGQLFKGSPSILFRAGEP